MIDKFIKQVIGDRDGFGRRRSVSDTQTGGEMGTPVFGGVIQEDERNRSLLGQAKYRTYSNILANTSIVAAGTRYFLNMLAKANWQVVPANDSDEAVRMAEFVESVMDDLDTPWHRVVRRAGMYRFYGFSVQEWTAVLREDGRFGLSDIAPRPQLTIERWDVDRKGTVFGVWQRSAFNGELLYIPRRKLVYMVDDTLNDSPEGLGLFRHIVEPAHRLGRFERLEGTGYETDLRGIPIGRGPFAEMYQQEQAGIITRQQRQAMEQPLRDFISKRIRNDAKGANSLGVMLDSEPHRGEDDAATPSSQKQWDVQLLTSQTTSIDTMGSTIERLNREIARILGVEGLLLGSTSVGSLAMSQDKSQNTFLIIEGTLREIVQTFQKDIITRLWEINGLDTELMPRFKTDPIQENDVGVMVDSLVKMATAGAVLPPDDPAFEVIRSRLNLPQNDLTDMELDAMLRPPEQETPENDNEDN